ncbi:MAG: dihydroneopterin aldolase [Candidatus Pacebacteria bacterium]|nr:dihydroneopterin aldolase [Candidatus Paceibacterota bacterium]
MDTIRLSNITLQAAHGCYDHEKKTPQTFVIDVECRLKTALDTGDLLEKTLNYEDIRSLTQHIFAQPPHNLIETLAVQIAEKLMEIDLVSEVRVKIAKPDVWEDCVPSVEVLRIK